MPPWCLFWLVLKLVFWFLFELLLWLLLAVGLELLFKLALDQKMYMSASQVRNLTTELNGISLRDIQGENVPLMGEQMESFPSI